MTYKNNIEEQLKKYELYEPIYIKTLAHNLSLAFNLPEQKAKRNTSTIIKRILEQETDLNLRFYSKGIYYKTKKNIFGELGINKQKVIEDKYLSGYRGYETGLSLMHKLSLTTQIPICKTYATNEAYDAIRYIDKYDIYLRPGKTRINKENIKYLQILDVIELLNKAPIDAYDPYKIISNYIRTNNLKYDILLCIAKKYYNKNIILELANIAERTLNELTF